MRNRTLQVPVSCASALPAQVSLARRCRDSVELPIATTRTLFTTRKPCPH